jgi:hypothetical protein
MTTEDLQAPSGVVEGLKAAAICHTFHPGGAAVALIRAAADILCGQFGPDETGQIIVATVTEALAFNGVGGVPVGRA